MQTIIDRMVPRKAIKKLNKLFPNSKSLFIIDLIIIAASKRLKSPPVPNINTREPLIMFSSKVISLILITSLLLVSIEWLFSNNILILFRSFFKSVFKSGE